MDEQGLIEGTNSAIFGVTPKSDNIVSSTKARDRIVSDFVAYKNACEKEVHSYLIHKTNVREVASFLLKKSMLVFSTVFLLFELLILSVGFFLFGIWEIGGFHQGENFVYIVVIVSLCAIVATFLISKVFRFRSLSWKHGWILHLVQIAISLCISLLLIVSQKYYQLLGVWFYCLTFIGLGMAFYIRMFFAIRAYYVDPVITLGGEVLNPKFYEDSILRVKISNMNGRIDKEDDLSSFLLFYKISNKRKHKIMAKCGVYDSTHYASSMMVPTVLLKALETNASANQLIELIKETHYPDINKVDIYGRSYLECAIEFIGNQAYCYQLLKEGANPNKFKSTGDIPLPLFHFAIQEGLMTKMLMGAFLSNAVEEKLGLWENSLWFFVRYAQPFLSIEDEKELTILLVNKGYNVNDVEIESGNTTLHIAAIHKPYLYTVLVELGADEEALNAEGKKSREFLY